MGHDLPSKKFPSYFMIFEDILLYKFYIFVIREKIQPCWDLNPESPEPESDALPLSHRA